MTVCANRSDNPGFFTPCTSGGRRCVCADQVAADQQSDLDTQENR